jgi:hypothetical protein
MKKIISIGLLFLGLLTPFTPAGAAGYLTLSQTNVSVNAGSSIVITASPLANQVVNVTSITNSAVAYAIVSGSQITIYGLSAGTTQITFCTYDNSCATSFVTVNTSGTNNNSQVSFSQNNLNLSTNQTSTVTVFNTNGSVYISNNSNSSVVSAFVSGTNINLTGLNTGSSTITVCASNSQCAYLYVTVNSNNVGQISFNQNNVTLNVSDILNIIVNNPTNNSLYLSNNSNANALVASLSGNVLNLRGQNQGSSVITVCVTNTNTCANLNVTVNFNSTSNLTFSPNPVSLNQYQTMSVNIYSNNTTNYYISNNSNSNAVSASINGSMLTLYGQNIGTSTITICTSNTNQCGTLNVTIGGGNNQGNLFFITNSLPSLPQPRVNQYYSYQLDVSGGIAPYNYYVYSGYLPTGLSLSSSGLIYGTPSNTAISNFSVRVADNYGRSGISQNFTLSPTMGSIAGSLIYNNGTLINDNGTIYITYKNTKSGFGSMFAFTSHGFQLKNVINASTAGLTNSGFVIVATADNIHPWGSWIKNGSTIYFVHDSGLIPIPSMDIFTSNGGLIANVVEASGYDFNRPMQYPMQFNDPRLR